MPRSQRCRRRRSPRRPARQPDSLSRPPQRRGTWRAGLASRPPSPWPPARRRRGRGWQCSQHVRAASGDDHLDDRPCRSARTARPSRRLHQESGPERRAAHSAVPRGGSRRSTPPAPRRCPRSAPRSAAFAQQRVTARASACRAGRRGWMRARETAPRRHRCCRRPAIWPLVEHRNALIGPMAPARDPSRRCSAVEALVQRLQAQPRRKDCSHRPISQQQLAPCRSVAGSTITRRCAGSKSRAHAPRCAGSGCGSSSTAPVMRRCCAR